MKKKTLSGHPRRRRSQQDSLINHLLLTRSMISLKRPDWLVLFMSALFLLTLLIAWLVDIPALLH